MNAYRITVAGLQYIAIAPSQAQAALDADRLHPGAWAAQVKPLHRTGGRHAR
ncbi:hypothetical protein [Xylophilus ampelinus]|uniref:Uncharacterized protein n=1 Tax=Xylophilus ampelinus TaxID=54067 RepID=A0A318SRI8_9BURK|nr:hypothetical protein [Xylophilus ampelinus]MCS4509164.1 hypothetical protein [Xylophilus ampelinus]PYE79810.1 hypothetical protein DFQ15_101130 [Xylophilus ampelinus]